MCLLFRYFKNILVNILQSNFNSPDDTNGDPQIGHNRNHKHQTAKGKFESDGCRRPRPILRIIGEEVPFTPVAFVIKSVDV